MKDTLTRITAVFLIGLGIATTSISADPIKGEKILNRAIHDDCAIPAPRVALMHSIAEWDALIAAGKMESEVAKLCNRKTAIKPFRPKYSKYVAEYLEHYANDSGAIPA